MLRCLPLAFAECRDAGAVDQQMQSRRRWLRPDRQRRVLLTSVNGLKLGIFQSR